MLFKDMDWYAIWDAENAASFLSRRRDDVTAEEFWDARAQRFNEDTKREETEDLPLLRQVAPITETTTILDVGAGPGRFSIPLAQDAKVVTAVEPSPEMVKYLRENATAAEQVDKIRVLQQRWETVRVGTDVVPHDIVIVPYAIGLMDIRVSLPALLTAAKQHLFLFTWVTRHTPAYQALWQTIHGEPLRVAPQHLLLLGMFHAQGYHANLALDSRTWETGYANFEESVVTLQSHINTEDPAHEALIRDYCEKYGRGDSDGFFLPDGGISAMVWLDKNIEKTD